MNYRRLCMGLRIKSANAPRRWLPTDQSLCIGRHTHGMTMGGQGIFHNMHDARQVANFLLDHADSRGIKLTNMEVLKHIYFAHGWHLASRGEPLISNRVEAWEHGPVIRAVYDAFKSFGSGPIMSRAAILDWETGELTEARGDFCAETTSLLRSTLDYYSGYGAFELSAITHEPGGPWHQVWNAPDGKVKLNMEISNSLIHRHFTCLSSGASIQ
ncbi:Panacea domain-containing protein [Sphingomonas sp.]|uniref:Panacea domain-containing protein n=1 Tax=Sphingomonas sp. TaxID=28214 RepID=UPI002EDA0781